MTKIFLFENSIIFYKLFQDKTPNLQIFTKNKNILLVLINLTILITYNKYIEIKKFFEISCRIGKYLHLSQKLYVY